MHPHVVPIRTYLIVAAWLGLLMVLTVWAARYNLGMWNTPLALAIALTKAALIVLFFMHVRYGSPLLRIFAAGGFLWLLILFGLTMSDVLTRDLSTSALDMGGQGRPQSVLRRCARHSIAANQPHRDHG